ncbi:MAG: SRPBCC domain-containing protein [Reyranella sp.]|uniref:SRPBCC family protein n=1 Tax=Reyranella sp. TaxID=1929291 RepID=UPI003D0EDAE0
MPARASDPLALAARDFTLTRLLAAPRDLVFRSFVEPDRMRHWWVPRGFTMMSCKLDLREGGAWRMTIRADDTGSVQTEVGVYREIREPERLAFTHAWVRANGTLTRPTLVTAAFAEAGAKTRVTFRQEDFATAAACQSHEEGWGVSLDQLVDYVSRP